MRYLRTLLQCVCTQGRNCIGQLSPFSEYAPTALRNKWKPAATIKLIHYRRLGAKPHKSSASDGDLGIQCLQRFQSLDATRSWDCRYPAQRAARAPFRREPAGFAMPFRSYPTLKFSAEVFPFGETLVTTTFPRTSTRGFAAQGEPGVAVCLLPGTELAFEQDVKYDQGWIWPRTASFRVAKFGVVEPNVPHRHHDAIEFPDGSNVLVTLLIEGQRATVLQLPVVHQISERTTKS